MIIYSCITNGYDEIPDNNYYDSDIHYVMFHDGTIEKKGPWEFIKIDNLIEDPFTKAHYYKILPYNVFDKNEKLVWIDGCRVHTKKFVEKTKWFFMQELSLAFLMQQKFTTFLESIECDYFVRMNITPQEIIQYSQLLKSKGWSFIKPKINNFVMWSNGIDKNFCDTWWELFLLGPKRDYISMIASLEFCEKEYYKFSNYKDDIISQSESVYKPNRKKDYYWKKDISDIEIYNTMNQLKQIICS